MDAIEEAGFLTVVDLAFELEAGFLLPFLFDIDVSEPRPPPLFNGFFWPDEPPTSLRKSEK